MDSLCVCVSACVCAGVRVYVMYAFMLDCVWEMM